MPSDQADGSTTEPRTRPGHHDLLRVRVDRDAGGTRVTANGEIDHDSAPMLEATLTDALRDPGTRLQVDLGAVTFFDCAGLNALLQTRSTAQANNVTLTLTRTPAPVLRLLDLTGTRPLFTLTAPRPLPRYPTRAGSLRGRPDHALLVGLRGSAQAPRRLLVRLDDGRHVVTDDLNGQQSRQIARAACGRLAQRTSTSTSPSVVHWLARPLPVRVFGTTVGVRFMALENAIRPLSKSAATSRGTHSPTRG